MDRAPTARAPYGRPSLYDPFADAFAASRPEPWPEVTAFLDELPDDPGLRVLDLGCAHGRHMRDRAWDVGLDGSRALLGLNPHRGRLVQGALLPTPFRDACFDAVVCVAVVHHLMTAERRLAACREVLRVARPGAPVLLSGWRHDQGRFEEGPQDVEVPFTDGDGVQHLRPYHLVAEGELAGLMEKAGASGVEERAVRGNRWVRGRAP